LWDMSQNRLLRRGQAQSDGCKIMPEGWKEGRTQNQSGERAATL
jgi:hypothetical protein